MHIVLKNTFRPPYPENLKQIHFGMGCFWGAERLFWEKKGVWSTAVGYSGGHSENPNYEKICTGKTGHAEIVKVIFDPLEITFLQLATLFWTSHDPTQGMRQGNDIGSQYRSIVLANDTNEIEESEINQLKSLTSEACEMVESFRKKEGLDLQNEFCKRVGEIRKLMDEIVPFEKERLDATKERLLKGLNEINSEKVDNNRFEQEMIFYIEKLDIAEEKMRLSNHLSYFEETLELPNSGKKLGFIAQEMGREINTIGSKCNHSEMQRRVVLMKDSLEKIKEQVLNTL